MSLSKMGLINPILLIYFEKYFKIRIERLTKRRQMKYISHKSIMETLHIYENVDNENLELQRSIY